MLKRFKLDAKYCVYLTKALLESPRILVNILSTKAAAMLSVSAMAADFNQAQRSANQGDVDTQTLLGELYYEGKDVRQNTATAKELFGKAGSNGDQDGCDNSGKDLSDR